MKINPKKRLFILSENHNSKKQVQFASIETHRKMEVVIIENEHAKKVSYDFY